MNELLSLHQKIAREILKEYQRTHRQLPWRSTKDPYAIWVSEIMLQQTQSNTVIPYYHKWLKAFPTVDTLARAQIDTVLSIWSGLGYYRRAHNLHHGAREVMTQYNGTIPSAVNQLLKIPGIGRYTAGAIASIAHNQPVPVVDGNVARILSRLFLIETPLDKSATIKQLWSLADSMLIKDNPGDFNQAMMEFGATICKPKQPQCTTCSVAQFCKANQHNKQHLLPIRKSNHSPELPILIQKSVWIYRNKKLLFLHRHNKGLFGGMWELPSAETEQQLTQQTLGIPMKLSTDVPITYTQKLSHRLLKLSLTRASLSKGSIQIDPQRYQAFRWQPLDIWASLPLSSGMKHLIKQYLKSMNNDLIE